MESSIFFKRRSIFPAQYTDAIIDDQVVRDILAEANQAPSHKNTEPWRFTVYSGPAKADLGDVLATAYESYTPEDKFSVFKQKKVKQKCLISSHVIAIGMVRHADSGLPEWEEIAAVACAVQNIYLSCTMRGLGCYWSSPKYLCEHPEIINLPEDQRSLGLVYLGVPKEDLTFNVEKGPAADKTIWVHQDSVDADLTD